MDWITWWCVFCAALSPAPRLLWICLFLRLTWSGIVQWPPFWPAETFLHVQGASCTADSRCVIAEACPDTCTALTFLLRRITPICVASTSVSAISQTPWNTAWGLLRSWHDVPILFQNPAWQAQTDTAVFLWVSRAKYQFRLWSSSWPFCSDSPELCNRHMVMWFGCHGDAFGTTENAFFHAFKTLRSQFHLHHRSHLALMEIVSKITPNLGLVL